MPNGHDFGHMVLDIDGVVLSDCKTMQKPEIADSASTPIMGGGGRRIATADRAKANGFDYQFAVAMPSADEHTLWLLAQGTAGVKREVSFKWTYTSPEVLPDGSLVGLTAKGKLNRGAADLGDEPGEMGFTFIAYGGYTASFKGKPDIVVT